MIFEDWLRSSLPALLRYSTVLCGPGLAEEIVQDVAIKVHDQWSTIVDLEQPHACARKMITGEYLSGLIKRSRPTPQTDPPDMSDKSISRTQLHNDLDGLPDQQRAVLVLTYVEGLDDEGIAEVLEASEQTVADHFSRAIATLKIGLTADEPVPQTEETHHTRTEEDLRACLHALSEQSTDPDALLESITSQLKLQPNKKRRTGLVLVLATLAIIAAIITPQFFGDGLVDADDARVPGNWNLVHQVKDPPNGWATIVAFIDGESETSWLGPPGSLDESGPGCTIKVQAAGQADPSLWGVGRVPVTIQGQPGFFSEANSDYEGGVSWPYSADAWANVACRDRALTVDKELSMNVADKVVFKASESRLPFKLSKLPDAYRLEGVAPQLVDGENAILTGLFLTSNDEASVIISVGSIDELSGGEGGPEPREWENETINGLPAKLSAEAAELVFDVRGDSIHIRAWGFQMTGEEPGIWSPGQRELLMETAKSLTIADDLSDEDTWYELNSTLPS